MSSKKRSSRFGILNLILGGLVSAGCILWIFRSIDRNEILLILREANFIWLVFAFIFSALAYILRAWRWIDFFSEKKPKFMDSFRCLIVGFFMNNTLPARMGEFVRAHLGGKLTKQSRSLVLATIAGERLADGLMISLLFIALFGFSWASFSEVRELYFVAIFFIFVSLSLIIFLLFRSITFRFLEWLALKLPWHFSRAAIVRIQRFIEGLEPLLEVKRFCKITIQSLIIWSVELVIYFFVSLTFQQHLSVRELALFLTSVNFSSLIPSAPGGVGVIEVFATAALTRVQITREVALAMVLTQHFIQIVTVGLPGAYYFFVYLGGKVPSSENGGRSN